MSNNIEVIGVTPAASFPKYSPHDPVSQICETDKLCIPEQKPSMECILEVKVSISVCSHKIICTTLGEKLIIEGIKHIRVMYVADEPCQSVHSAHFDIPFYTFILLKEKKCEINNILASVEDISIKQLDCRCFSVSLIIFICAELRKKNYGCGTKKHSYINCYGENKLYKYRIRENDKCDDMCDDNDYCKQYDKHYDKDYCNCDEKHKGACDDKFKCEQYCEDKDDVKIDAYLESKTVNEFNHCNLTYEGCKDCTYKKDCPFLK
jgi:hypothetical protein